MLVTLMMSLVIATILIVIPKIGTPHNARDILEKKRFVFVQNPKFIESRGEDYGKGFDLGENAFFNPNNVAVKKGKKHGGFSTDDSEKTFNKIKRNEFSSALLNSHITTDEIKKSKYQVVLSTESVVDKSLFESKFVPELELKYALKEQEFSKIRITYNKEFLPTKIEWYYKGEEGLKWYTWRTYSYPFKSKEEFDKRLDEEIANIEEITRENEGD